MSRPSWLKVFICFLFLVSLLYISYITARSDSTELLLLYGLLFVLYLIVTGTSDSLNYPFYLRFSVVARAALLFSIPNLSEDFYRFIWDGRMWHAGYHPFLAPPSEWVDKQIPGLSRDLFLKLNSPGYFTVYPPLLQGIFFFAVWIFPNSVYGSLIVMKLILLLSELGNLWLIGKLLKKTGGDRRHILLYALNPLVILEGVGNLHFDPLMLFFLLAFLRLCVDGKAVRAAVLFALSICTKLLPLMLLPMLPAYMRPASWIKFTILTLALVLVLFLPLYHPDLLSGYQHGVGYYFRKFEFNASLYYLYREWGYWYYGYNIIERSGPNLGYAAVALILLYSAIRIYWARIRKPSELAQPLATDIQWILFIFLMCTTTVHPWYIIPLIGLASVTGFRFGIVWSFVIFLTYANYGHTPMKENLFLVTMEYVVVLAYLTYECIWKKRIAMPSLSL